jgi:hypothetical protein
MPRCIWRSRCLTTSTPRRVESSSESDCPAVVVGRVRRSPEITAQPEMSLFALCLAGPQRLAGLQLMLIPGRLRSRLIFCVMSLMAQGAHRGRPVAAAPCTPGLRPAKSPLRGAFDLSLQAAGRAEAASLQNTALSPHPCGLPRPSGNVSAILRPPAPAVSVSKIDIRVGRVRRSRHPAK